MSEQPKKNLIIFDFDQTITKKDSLYSQLILLNNPLEKQKIIEMDQVLNYVDVFNYFYQKTLDLKIPLSAINHILDNIPLSPGMEELFKYLRNNREHFSILVISSNYEYAVKRVLTSHNIIDLIDGIYSNKFTIDEEKNLIKVIQKQTHNCKDCNPCQCKKEELNLFYITHNINRDNFLKVLFIADGGNDLCLTKTLNQKDIVFPRIGYSLHNKLSNIEIQKTVQCKICPWENAESIIKFLNN